jgi:hypothetical protein
MHIPFFAFAPLFKQETQMRFENTISQYHTATLFSNVLLFLFYAFLLAERQAALAIVYADSWAPYMHDIAATS